MLKLGGRGTSGLVPGAGFSCSSVRKCLAWRKNVTVKTTDFPTLAKGNPRGRGFADRRSWREEAKALLPRQRELPAERLRRCSLSGVSLEAADPDALGRIGTVAGHGLSAALGDLPGTGVLHEQTMPHGQAEIQRRTAAMDLAGRLHGMIATWKRQAPLANPGTTHEFQWTLSHDFSSQLTGAARNPPLGPCATHGPSGRCHREAPLQHALGRPGRHGYRHVRHFRHNIQRKPPKFGSFLKTVGDRFLPGAVQPHLPAGFSGTERPWGTRPPPRTPPCRRLAFPGRPCPWRANRHRRLAARIRPTAAEPCPKQQPPRRCHKC